MSVEHLLTQYLFQNKSVELQGIGKLKFVGDILLDSDKNQTIQEGAIQFEFDPKAEPDEGLIEFIVSHSRKMKALAISDVESYTILNKQFMNIGKPFTIIGIGSIYKTNAETFEFVQGKYVSKTFTAIPEKPIERTREDISFTSQKPQKKGSHNLFLISIFSILSLLALATAYYFFFIYEKSASEKITEQPTANVADSTKDILSSNITKQDSVTAQPYKSNDNYTFKVAIKEYKTRALAENSAKRFETYGHKIIISSVDSTKYKLLIPFSTPLSDTTRAKDSLFKIFQFPTYISN